MRLVCNTSKTALGHVSVYKLVCPSVSSSRDRANIHSLPSFLLLTAAAGGGYSTPSIRNTGKEHAPVNRATRPLAATIFRPLAMLPELTTGFCSTLAALLHPAPALNRAQLYTG